MKRFLKFTSLVVVACICVLTLTGCGIVDVITDLFTDDEYESDWQCIGSYKLIAAKVETQTNVNAEFSGKFLICFGGMSGNVTTSENTVYKYWYQRSDGGILAGVIDMASEDVEWVVVYEDDEATPKVEIWQDFGRPDYKIKHIEYRFTIPSGTFVNTFDFQGI